MIKNFVLRLVGAALSLSLILISLSGCFTKEEERVLLISVDGLRADKVVENDYARYLTENTAYSLEVKAASPSITLPCHMSMFHSVSSEVHGVDTNTYTPSATLGLGIAEALSGAGKTAAMFYNWREIGYLATEGTLKTDVYFPGETEGWEETNRRLGDACVEYLNDAPADFVFLYLGFVDAAGHTDGWLSEEYYYAQDQSFTIISEVIAAAKAKGYTVIITADHGGHDNTHGTLMKEDMTIPLFIIGNDFCGGRNLGALSILDVAPTVNSIMGVEIPEYWQGKVIE